MMVGFRWLVLALSLALAAPGAAQTDDGQPAAGSVIELVHESREALGSGDLDRALRSAAAAVDADPAYAAAWKQQGRVQMLRGDYAEALTSLRTALELAPEDSEVRAWIPRLLLEMGNFKAMIEVLEALDKAEIERLDPEWLAGAVHRLLTDGELRIASRLAAKLAETAPAGATTGVASALDKITAGDLTGAQQNLLAVGPGPGRWGPLLAAAWSGVGRAYLDADRPAPAITALRRALRLRPDWLPAQRDLGWAYRRAGQPAVAAQVWADAVEASDRPRAWWLWIAEARFEAGETQAVVGAADRVLQLDPGNRRAQTLRVAALTVVGDEAAVARMREALTDEPGGRRVLAMGGALAASSQGDYAAAAEQLESLHRQAPGDAEVTDALAEAYAGWAAAETGADTIAPLEKLVALEPERAGAWRDLGWGYWVAGRVEESLDAWDRAVRLGVDRRERLAVQVVARLVERGQSEQAIAVYRRWFPDAGLLGVGRQLVDAGLLPAAEPILLEAWEQGEARTAVGVELGYVEARAGICVAVPERFGGVMDHLDALTERQIGKVLEALAACADDPGVEPFIDRVFAAFGDTPAYKAQLADLLLRAAETRDRGEAFALYRDSLTADPDQPGVWLRAARLGEALGREDEVRRLLADVAARTRSAAVDQGIQGYQAQRAGRVDAAAAHYRQSLEAEPAQPALRMALFEVWMSQEQYDRAREQADWFVRRWLDGDMSVRSYLAEIRTAFGEGPEALQHWEELYLSSPGTAYYGVEAARVLFDMCRPARATQMLEQVASLSAAPRAHELLAEIALARGDPEEALRWTARGLEHGETAALHRLRAEAAEAVGQPSVARGAAQSLLARDPGNVPIARLLGRALIDLGEEEAARQHFASLLARNERFTPALVRLRDFASQRGDTDEAARLATALVEQRPWDPGARRRYGVALAENKSFRPALQTLRREADRPTGETVPILVYSGVSGCDYPGRTTASQVVGHIGRLSDEGYRLVGPEALIDPGATADPARVVIMLSGADAHALERIDAALAAAGGRAVYAATGVERSRADLQALLATERWIPASAGPVDNNRRAVNEAGVRGNPLTHTLYQAGALEDTAALRERLSASMARAAAPLSDEAPEVLLYPGGDYGQQSLDTGEPAMRALRSAVADHFELAIAGDDGGFATPRHEDHDPYRLPGRIVPPGWDDEALVAHLRQQHPATQGKLQLAKALFWNAQHVRADYRFEQAGEAGADTRELYLHWGANAYREGDLAAALDKLRIAARLDPESERVRSTLEAAKWQRRPLLELRGLAWEDSDDRRYDRLGATFGAYLRDDLRLELFADRNRWDRDGLGEEQGLRVGAGGRWYFAEGRWLDGQLWRMDMEDVDDFTGGRVNVHWPVPAVSGAVDLYGRRDPIETVEAIRDGTLQESVGASVHSRIRDVWDLYADPRYVSRTDGNDGWFLEGRLVRRLAEWPFLGLGYRYRFGDSDRDPPGYWAPEGLQQHQLYATVRGEQGSLYYNASVEAGYARETGRDRRFVWGGRARLEYALTRRLRLSGELNRLETPDYDRTGAMLGLDWRF